MPARIKNWKFLIALVGLALLLPAPGCATAAPAQPTSTPLEPASSPAANGPGPVKAAPVGTGVGDRIPDFTLNLADGSTVTSQDLISQRQPTFLFFFATW